MNGALNINRKIVKIILIVGFFITIFLILSNVALIKINNGGISKINITKDGETIKSVDVNNSLQTIIRPGTYKITSTDNNGNQSTKIIDVKPFRISTFSIGLNDKLSSYPVYNGVVTYAHKLKDNSYIGIGNGGFLKKITNERTTDLSYEDTSGEYGSQQKLTNLNNGYFFSESNENPPLLINTNKNFIGSIVARDKEIRKSGTYSSNNFWIVFDNEINYYEPPYKNPHKKFTFSDLDLGMYSEIIATENHVLLFNPDQVYDIEDFNAKNTKPVLINTVTGKKVELENQLANASFSPDGKKIAYLDAESKFIEIYDVDKSKISGVIDQPDSINIYWLNNEELFFETQNQIWKYNLNESYSSLFAETEGTPTSIVFSKDEITTTTNPTPSNAKIWTIPISNKVPNSLIKLNDSLPVIETNFQLDYNHIGQPLINATITIPLNNINPGRLLIYNQRYEETKKEIQTNLKSLGLENIPIRYIDYNDIN